MSIRCKLGFHKYLGHQTHDTPRGIEITSRCHRCGKRDSVTFPAGGIRIKRES